MVDRLMQNQGNQSSSYLHRSLALTKGRKQLTRQSDLARITSEDPVMGSAFLLDKVLSKVAQNVKVLSQTRTPDR